MSNHLLMAYLLSNICTKNYWNRTTIVQISLVVGWYPFLRDTVFLAFHFCSLPHIDPLVLRCMTHFVGIRYRYHFAI